MAKKIITLYSYEVSQLMTLRMVKTRGIHSTNDFEILISLDNIYSLDMTYDEIYIICKMSYLSSA